MAIPAPHNLSLMGNTTGIVDLMQTVDQRLMHGMFGLFLLVAIFLISYFMFMQAVQHTGKAFLGAAFIGALSAFLLRALELLHPYMMYASIAVLAGLAAFIKQRD